MRRIIGRVRSIAWDRVVRYSGVSVFGLVLTQVLLVAAHVGLGAGATVSNVAAVTVTSVPVFLLNRQWVWKVAGPSSLRREVVPFWAFTAAGLVLSTLAVAAVAAVTTSGLAVSAANIVAFGTLWVAKFFVLDEVCFAPVARAEELAAV